MMKRRHNDTAFRFINFEVIAVVLITVSIWFAGFKAFQAVHTGTLATQTYEECIKKYTSDIDLQQHCGGEF